MLPNFTSLSGSEFRRTAHSLEAGPYTLVEEGKPHQYAYVEGHGDIVYGTAEDIGKVYRKRHGDLYSDAFAVAKETADVDGTVKIYHLAGIPKMTTSRGCTTIDPSPESRQHVLFIPLEYLEKVENATNGSVYLAYADMALPDIFIVIREENGQLTAGDPKQVNWLPRK